MLKDRVCIVTGAARGIGQRLALHLAGLGADIVAADREGCETTLKLIRETGGRAVAARGDVTVFAEAQQVAGEALAAFGRIDALVNNAALYGGIQIRGFEDIPEPEWDAMMSVNVKGVWHMCKAVVPEMRRQEAGRIVNVSSNVIFMGKPGFLHYVTSKGAVWALTGALSRELAGSNITVNAIAPGYTITEATRTMSTPENVRELEEQILQSQSVKRLIEPDDLVGAVSFLVSDAAGQITGQTITVDGGTITR